MRRIYATPRLGEELLEKMGILEKTPEKKVESPREKGEQKRWKLQKGELRLTIKNKQEIKTYSELVEKVGDNLSNFLIDFLTGNYVTVSYDFVKIGKGILDIPNYRRWSNFYKFLCSGRFVDEFYNVNYDLLRSLSEILEQEGNAKENAKRIVYIVFDMECDLSVRYIGRLTEALINHKILFKQYFRCLKIISNIIVEDIELLAIKMENKDYDYILNDEATIEFVNNGLLIQKEGRLIPTNLAYDLINCGVRWGHMEIEKPHDLPGIEIIDTRSLAALEMGEEIQD